MAEGEDTDLAMETAAGELAAIYVVNTIVDRGAELLQENRMRRLEAPYAATAAMLEMQRVLTWQFYRHDTGEPTCPVSQGGNRDRMGEAVGDEHRVAGDGENAGEEESCTPPPPPPDDPSQQQWVAEAEPPVVLIENWARTVVKAKPRVKPAALTGLAHDTGSELDTARSTMSRTSTRGGTRRAKGSMKLSENSIEEIMVIEVNEPTHEKGGSQVIQLTDTERAYDAEVQLKRLEEARILEERQRREQEIHHKQESWNKKMAELKGKPYTLDASGDIIVISSIKPDRLPGGKVGVEVQDSIKPLPKSGRRSTTSPTKPGANTNPRRTAAHSSEAPSAEAKRPKKQDFFSVSPSIQPPLHQVMSISAGVGLQSGGNRLQGPPLEMDSNRMTRGQYLAKSEAGSMTGSQYEDDLTTLPGELDAAPSTAADPQSPEPHHDSQIRSPRRPSPRGSPLGEENLALAGGQSRSVNAPEDASVGSHGAGEPTDEDENLKLVSAPDWGRVGEYKEPQLATLPHKPDAKARMATVSSRPKLPRDRLAQDAITFTGQAKKLPAPPLGASTGHGMMHRKTRSPGRGSGNSVGTGDDLSSFHDGSTIASRNMEDSPISRNGANRREPMFPAIDAGSNQSVVSNRSRASGRSGKTIHFDTVSPATEEVKRRLGLR